MKLIAMTLLRWVSTILIFGKKGHSLDASNADYAKFLNKAGGLLRVKGLAAVESDEFITKAQLGAHSGKVMYNPTGFGLTWTGTGDPTIFNGITETPGEDEDGIYGLVTSGTYLGDLFRWDWNFDTEAGAWTHIDPIPDGTPLSVLINLSASGGVVYYGDKMYYWDADSEGSGANPHWFAQPENIVENHAGMPVLVVYGMFSVFSGGAPDVSALTEPDHGKLYLCLETNGGYTVGRFYFYDHYIKTLTQLEYYEGMQVTFSQVDDGEISLGTYFEDETGMLYRNGQIFTWVYDGMNYRVVPNEYYDAVNALNGMANATMNRLFSVAKIASGAPTRTADYAGDLRMFFASAGFGSVDAGQLFMYDALFDAVYPIEQKDGMQFTITENTFNGSDIAQLQKTGIYKIKDLGSSVFGVVCLNPDTGIRSYKFNMATPGAPIVIKSNLIGIIALHTITIRVTTAFTAGATLTVKFNDVTYTLDADSYDLTETNVIVIDINDMAACTNTTGDYTEISVAISESDGTAQVFVDLSGSAPEIISFGA